jgi:hypothetical protein
MPIGVSPWAMAAGYLGLFALVVLPAPLALVFGLLAQRDLRRRPHLRGRARAWFAVVVGALGTVLLVFTLGAFYGQSE